MAPPAPRGPNPSLAWALFGLRGRVSRQTFWLVQIGLIAVNSVLVAQLIGEGNARFHNLAVTVAPFVGVLTLAANLAVAVKRFHDFGMTGLFALGLIIPVANVIVTIWAGVMPGDPGPNRYGSRPDSPA